MRILNRFSKDSSDRREKAVLRRNSYCFFIHTHGFGGLDNMVTNLANHLDLNRLESTTINLLPYNRSTTEWISTVAKSSPSIKMVGVIRY